MNVDFTLDQLKALRELLRQGTHKFSTLLDRGRNRETPLIATPKDYRRVLNEFAAMEAKVDEALSAASAEEMTRSPRRRRAG